MRGPRGRFVDVVNRAPRALHRQRLRACSTGRARNRCAENRPAPRRNNNHTTDKQNFHVVVDGGYFVDAKIHFSIETDGTWGNPPGEKGELEVTVKKCERGVGNFLGGAISIIMETVGYCLRESCKAPPLSGARSAAHWLTSLTPKLTRLGLWDA